MVVLLGHVFHAVAFYIRYLNHITPVATNDTEFTVAFMSDKVLLKHLSFTAKDSALDRCILAIILMTFKVIV